MPTEGRQNFMTENESNNDGSKHLKQCTGNGPVGKDCVAWTSIKLSKRIRRVFMNLPFVCGFCAASGLEECKTFPPSNYTDFASLFCADSNEQYGRRDNIRICGVREINYEVVRACGRGGKRCRSDEIRTRKQRVSPPAFQKPRITPNICKVCPT